MKRLEKLAIIITVFFFLNLLGGYPFRLFMSRWLGLEQYGAFTSITSIAAIWQLILRYCVNLAIAVWLWIDAKNKGFNKWIWSCLGLVYGVTGAIFYMFFRLVEKEKV